jgi:hypothetical protein
MTIRTQQHEIFDLAMTALLWSINDVVKLRLALGGTFKRRKRLARGCASIRFFFRQIAIRIAALVDAFS